MHAFFYIACELINYDVSMEKLDFFREIGLLFSFGFAIMN